MIMSLQAGTIGPYSVTAKTGEGGMGEVYRARDTKLDRDVVLKVLPTIPPGPHRRLSTRPLRGRAIRSATGLVLT